MEDEMKVHCEEEHNTKSMTNTYYFSECLEKPSDQTPDQVMAESSSPLDRQAMLQYLSTNFHIVVADAPVVHDHEADIGLEIEMTGTGIQPDETSNQVMALSSPLPKRRPMWVHEDDIGHATRIAATKANTQNIIPPSFKETLVSLLLSLKSIPPSFKETVVSLLLSVKSIPPRTRCTLLVFFGSVIRFLAERLIDQFHIELGNSSDTTRALLSFGEAFAEFWPHIRDKTAVMVIYALVLLLIWPVQPAYQVMIIVMLFAVPVYYIPDLWGKMSGVDVTCGMIKLPLFCVTTSAAIALFFIFGFLILLVIYLIQRYIPPERSRGIILEGSNIMEDFSVMVDEMKEK